VVSSSGLGLPAARHAITVLLIISVQFCGLQIHTFKKKPFFKKKPRERWKEVCKENVMLRLFCPVKLVSKIVCLE
jgi:hypothetical protein